MTRFSLEQVRYAASVAIAGWVDKDSPVMRTETGFVVLFDPTNPDDGPCCEGPCVHEMEDPTIRIELSFRDCYRALVLRERAKRTGSVRQAS